MFNKFKNIKSKKDSDKGASQSLEFVVILMFIMFLAVSFIDAGLFFVVRSNYQSAAQQASRLAATYGEAYPNGSNPILKKNKGQTPIQYLEKTVGKPFTSTQKAGFVKSMNYSCTQGQVKMGDPIVCTIEYKYNSMSPVFSFIGKTSNSTIKVHGRSASEVTLFK